LHVPRFRIYEAIWDVDFKDTNTSLFRSTVVRDPYIRLNLGQLFRHSTDCEASMRVSVNMSNVLIWIKGTCEDLSYIPFHQLHFDVSHCLILA
ncbi:hypothetical protein PFISCL1PPCAC_27131, partial [Pristionchus fissidentatus]